MKSQIEMSMMGKINYFLALNICQRKEEIFINQENYTKNFLECFRMKNCSDVKLTMACGTHLSPSLDKPIVELKTY